MWGNTSPRIYPTSDKHALYFERPLYITCLSLLIQLQNLSINVEDSHWREFEKPNNLWKMQIFWADTEALKGTVARYFRTLAFSWIDLVWAPDSHPNIFWHSVSYSRRILRAPILGGQKNKFRLGACLNMDHFGLDSEVFTRKQFWENVPFNGQATSSPMSFRLIRGVLTGQWGLITRRKKFLGVSDPAEYVSTLYSRHYCSSAGSDIAQNSILWSLITPSTRACGVW